jgi:hypothetical protein
LRQAWFGLWDRVERTLAISASEPSSPRIGGGKPSSSQSLSLSSSTTWIIFLGAELPGAGAAAAAADDREVPAIIVASLLGPVLEGTSRKLLMLRGGGVRGDFGFGGVLDGGTGRGEGTVRG